MKQWLSVWRHPSSFGWRDVETGMHHGNIRWPEGQPPAPYGCRRCGFEQRFHGRRSLLGRPSHLWEQPTQAQIKARMVARRNARKSVCRCPLDGEWRPFAPVFDPYQCEASDCHGHFSELDPFGPARSVNEPSAEVSRKCGCGWSTTVWHVDDGSAEEELHGHVTSEHGVVYATTSGGGSDA